MTPQDCHVRMAGCTGCTVRDAIHVCDQLTYQHQIITDDSILCSITSCFLNKIYGSETWSDRNICMSLDKKDVSELTYDIETHFHDLVLSNKDRSYAQFEQDNYVSRLSSVIEYCNMQQCDCVTDVLGTVLQKMQWRYKRHSGCVAETTRVVCGDATRDTLEGILRSQSFEHHRH